MRTQRALVVLTTLMVLVAASPLLFAAGVGKLGFSKENTSGANPEWVLENYRLEVPRKGTPCISLKGYIATFHKDVTKSGTATTTFNGKPGYYKITVHFQDESDGASGMALRVDGKDIDRWTADGIFVTFVRKRTMRHIALKPGSKIQIWGKNNGTEYARFNAIEIAPDTAPPAEDTKRVFVKKRKYSRDLVLLGNYRGFADPNLMLPRPSATWPELRGGRNFTEYPTYLFAAKEDDLFQARVGASSRKGLNSNYVIAPAFSQKANTPTGKVQIDKGGAETLSYRVPADGLYTLRVNGAVSSPTHNLSREPGLIGNAAVYFFVPKDTDVFRVSASAQGSRDTGVVVKFPDGRVAYRGVLKSGTSADVRTPEEFTGRAWWISWSSIGPRVNLSGVPPYQALSPGALLVPKELLGKDATTTTAVNTDGIAGPPRALSSEAVMPDAVRFDLIRKGEPVCELVVPEGQDAAVLDAAELLQTYLQRISGGAPRIVNAPTAKPHALLAVAGGATPAPKELAGLGPEGIYVHSDAGRLRILGRSPIAVQHGVMTLLRRLGCRWYFPMQEWHVIPTGEDITVALHIAEEPSFRKRHISYGTGTDSGLKNAFEAWKRLNRMGSALKGSVHHSYASFVPYDLFEAHPEYFSMKDTNKDGIGDTRTRNQPCTTHPEVVRMFTEKAQKMMDASPDTDILPVSPNDGTPNMCRCERCRAVGSCGDTAVLIARQVADAIKPKHPDTLIGVYAYGRVAKPPEKTKPGANNLLVELATAYSYGTNLTQMLAEWPKYCEALGIRDYFAIPQWGCNSPGGGLQPSKAIRILPQYHEHKARILDAEAAGAWASAGLGMYLSSELTWDITANPRALLQRFYSDCFGKGADNARRYFERWDAGKPFNERTLKLSLMDLKEAWDKAERLDERKRTASLALYMHAQRARIELAEERREGDEDAVLAAIEAGDQFLWRFKELGLTHEKAGWNVEKDAWPYFTLDEARGILESDLKALDDVLAVEFRDEYEGELAPIADLVLKPRTPSAPPWWQRVVQLDTLVRLGPGKPLRLQIRQGGRAGKGTIELRPTTGRQVLVSKSVDLTGDAQTVQLDAPEAGLYRVLVQGNFSARIVAPRNYATRGAVQTEGGGVTLYFYVPPKTEAFSINTSAVAGREVKIMVADARGKLIEKFAAGRGQRTISVPKASAGQVWRIIAGTPPGRSSIGLSGVPPHFSLEPDRLLVPAGEQ